MEWLADSAVQVELSRWRDNAPAARDTTVGSALIRFEDSLVTALDGGQVNLQIIGTWGTVSSPWSAKESWELLSEGSSLPPEYRSLVSMALSPSQDGQQPRALLWARAVVGGSALPLTLEWVPKTHVLAGEPTVVVVEQVECGASGEFCSGRAVLIVYSPSQTGITPIAIPPRPETEELFVGGFGGGVKEITRCGHEVHLTLVADRYSIREVGGLLQAVAWRQPSLSQATAEVGFEASADTGADLTARLWRLVESVPVVHDAAGPISEMERRYTSHLADLILEQAEAAGSEYAERVNYRDLGVVTRDVVLEARRLESERWPQVRVLAVGGEVLYQSEDGDTLLTRWRFGIHRANRLTGSVEEHAGALRLLTSLSKGVLGESLEVVGETTR